MSLCEKWKCHRLFQAGHKPGSVSACHLSTTAVTHRPIYQPLGPWRVLRLATQSGQPRVYCPIYLIFQPAARASHLSPSDLVSSCLTFSPLPLARRFFSSTFTKHFCLLAVNERGVLCCPDFPLLSLPTAATSDLP